MSSTSYLTRPCLSESLPRCKWLLCTYLVGSNLGFRKLAVSSGVPSCQAKADVTSVFCGAVFPLQSEEEKHLPSFHAVHGPRDGNPLLRGEGEAEWGRL